MTVDQALAELHSHDPEARGRAIRWLRVRGGPRAVAALIGVLDDPSGDVLSLVLQVLGEMNAREAVPVLIQRLQSAHRPEAKRLFIDALGRIGDPRALPALIAALDDPEKRTIASACHALSGFDDPDAVDALLRLLNDPRWQVRKSACEGLFELEVTDQRLSAALERLAQEEPPPLEVNWENLARASGQDPHELERLVGEVTGDRYQRRCQWMLQELAQRRAEDGDEEAAGPKEDEDRVRRLKAAIAKLRDPDFTMRIGAVNRLGELGGAKAAAALLAALEDPEARVRVWAAHSLGGWTREAVPALIRHLLDDPSPRVREVCASALGDVEGEHVSEALRQALVDPDEGVVTTAVIRLGHRSDHQAVPRLLSLLEHPKRGVRFHSASAMLRLQVADQRLVHAMEKLAQDPEAEEYDLEAAEWNCNLDWQRELSAETSDPEPQPQMTMAEMIEQARLLLAREGA